MSDPGGVAGTTLEVALHSVYKQRKGGHTPKAKGLPHGEDPLGLATALFTVGSGAALAPHDRKAQSPFRPAGGWLNPADLQEDPKRIDLLQEAPGQVACLPFAVAVPFNQSAGSSIEGPPLAHIERCMGHVTKPLGFSGNVVTKAGDLGVLALRQSLGLADRMIPAVPPELNPLPIHPITIAYEHPTPVLDQNRKGFLGSPRMDHEESHFSAHYAPGPHKRSVFYPGGLIDVVEFSTAIYLPHRIIMESDGLGDPINELVGRLLADGETKYRAAEIMNYKATFAVAGCKLPDKCGEPRAGDSEILRGQLTLVYCAAVKASPFMKHKVGDLRANLGKLDHLMSTEREELSKLAVTERKPVWLRYDCLCGLHNRMAMPLATFLAPWLFAELLLQLLLERAVARRRLVGDSGVRAQLPLQFFIPGDHRLILATKQHQISTNGPRYHLPLYLREFWRALWGCQPRGESVEVELLSGLLGVRAFVYAPAYRQKRMPDLVARLFSSPPKKPPPTSYPRDQLPNTSRFSA
ncbi:MAG: hypothetical protein QXS68_08495, partial [Candidatus Methanomethylicaceae archaeon]